MVTPDLLSILLDGQQQLLCRLTNGSQMGYDFYAKVLLAD